MHVVVHTNEGQTIPAQAAAAGEVKWTRFEENLDLLFASARTSTCPGLGDTAFARRSRARVKSRHRFKGLARVNFQMNASSLPHTKLMRASEVLGTRVAPAVRKELAGVG